VAVGVLALVLALVALGSWWYLTGRNDGSVPLAAPSADATSTITLAGYFPAQSDAPLKNPLGIAVIGERVFVSESDAGAIREFAANGARRQVITLPRAPGGRAAYPADLAALGDEVLAVVDTASSRVFLVSLAAPDAAPLVVGADAPKTAPRQPTGVARVADGVAVADGSDHLIKVYDSNGSYLRSLGASLVPRLGFVGGMALADGRLYVADSNAGRVVALDPGTGAQVGLLPDRIQLPRGIAGVDGGRILVASTFDRSLVLYGTDAQAKASITQHTANVDALARLVLPKAVAWMAPTRRAYVADAGSGRVRVYNVAAGKSK
jgi:outer membrane protein assembly factor BamB